MAQPQSEPPDDSVKRVLAEYGSTPSAGWNSDAGSMPAKPFFLSKGGE